VVVITRGIFFFSVIQLLVLFSLGEELGLVLFSLGEELGLAVSLRVEGEGEHKFVGVLWERGLELVAFSLGEGGLKLVVFLRGLLYTLILDVSNTIH
jgi:hypothetical protein